MVLLMFNLNFYKKMKYSSTYPFLLWFPFFIFYNVVSFSQLSLIIERYFNVLLNQKIIHLFVKRFDCCLQGLNDLFQNNFVKFRYSSFFVVLFAFIL